MKKDKISIRDLAITIMLASTICSTLQAHQATTIEYALSSIAIKNEFYMGAAGGYDNYSVNYNINATTTVSTPALYNGIIMPISSVPFQFNQNLSVNGGLGGLFLGYGRSFEKYKAYLGAEIFGNGAGAQSNMQAFVQNSIPQNNPQYTLGNYLITQTIMSSVQVNSNFGINIHPGIKLHKSNLIYINLGYNLSNISVSQTLNTIVSFENDIYVVLPIDNATTNASQSKIVGGFAYGAGIEQAVYKNFSLRAAYVRTNYSNFQTNPIYSSNNTAENRYMLSLIYHV